MLQDKNHRQKTGVFCEYLRQSQGKLIKEQTGCS